MNHADDTLPDGRRWHNGALVSATDAARTDRRDTSNDEARMAEDAARIEGRTSRYMALPKAPLTTRGEPPPERANAGVSRELVSESCSVGPSPRAQANSATVFPIWICVDGTPTLVNFLTQA